MPYFSVVIPSYNRSDMTVDAVNSVLGQTFRDFEIIVVDDGSTDGTEQVLRRFGEKIRYHKQENAGVAAARNRGIALSGGDYICYLDSDDLWHPQKLALYKNAWPDRRSFSQNTRRPVNSSRDNLGLHPLGALVLLTSSN
jgi:glycosyltransferase involved in cell wall biosynthesis